MTQIQFLNARTGDRSPRNETHEPFDASKLFRFERAVFGSDLSFLLYRPASPVPPTAGYASKTPKRLRGKDKKPRLDRMTETCNLYLSAMPKAEWMSRNQIAANVGKAPTTVFERLQKLINAGYVEKKLKRGEKIALYIITAKGFGYVQQMSTNLQKD